MPFSLKWFLLLSFTSHVLEHSNETPYLLLLWVLLWIQTAMSSACDDSRWLDMGYLLQKLIFFDQNKHSYILCMTVLLMLMWDVCDGLSKFHSVKCTHIVQCQLFYCVTMLWIFVGKCVIAAILWSKAYEILCISIPAYYVDILLVSKQTYKVCRNIACKSAVMHVAECCS
jgi:hypothetical protein